MESMENIHDRIAALEQQMNIMSAHTRMVERRLRWWRGIACGLLIVGLISLPLPSGMAQEEPQGRAHKEEYPDKGNQGLAHRVKALEDQVKALQDTLAAVTFDATTNELVITGANLHIVNGLGTTNTTNGLGNLIVGYNESREHNPDCSSFQFTCTDVRTGSHNVVVGREHNFSSFGGLVVAQLNELSGQFASVSGTGNTASGFYASVSGGLFNTASGPGDSVSGGRGNHASGGESSVSGGVFNTASGNNSSVSGGISNTASFFWASVSGGDSNTASGRASSVSGGANRTAPDTDDWVAGSLFEDQ
jgi:hypothetical protein